MYKAPSYWQQSQSQMQEDGQQTEAEYQQEKIINKQEIHLPIEKGFMKKTRYHTLGALVFKNKMKQQLAGSGVLISKDIVLTAAHNLYDREYGQKTSRHRFYLGANGTTNTYYQVKKFIYLPQYEKDKGLKYEFGLIKLGKLINPQINEQQDQNEYLQLSVPCKKCIMKKDTKISVYGYPGYKDNYCCKDDSGENIKLLQYGYQKEDAIIEHSSEQGKICYSMSTLHAHSGSPVVSDNKIIAVHIGSAINQNDCFNKGRLITFQMIETLKKWYTQLNIDKDNFFRIHKLQCIHSSAQNKISYLKTGHPDPLFYHSSVFLRNSKKNQPQKTQKKEGRNSLLDNSKIHVKSMNSLKPNKSSKNLKTSKRTIEQHLQQAKMLFKQGKKMFNKENYAQALTKYNQCLSILEQTKGKDCLQSAPVFRCIGAIYYNQDQFDEAKINQKKSISIYKQFNIKDEEYAKSVGNLGITYFAQQKYTNAKLYYQQALQIYQQFEDEQKISEFSKKIEQCSAIQKKTKLNTAIQMLLKNRRQSIRL